MSENDGSPFVSPPDMTDHLTEKAIKSEETEELTSFT